MDETSGGEKERLHGRWGREWLRRDCRQVSVLGVPEAKPDPGCTGGSHRLVTVPPLRFLFSLATWPQPSRLWLSLPGSVQRRLHREGRVVRPPRPSRHCAARKLRRSWDVLSANRFLSTSHYHHLNGLSLPLDEVGAPLCLRVVLLWDANLIADGHLKFISYEEFVCREALSFVTSLFPPIAAAVRLWDC